MKPKPSAVKVMPPQHDEESIADLMQKVLLKIGEDPERPGLLHLPYNSRFSSSLNFGECRRCDAAKW